MNVEQEKVCRSYALDRAHVPLIGGRPYITRDGMLVVAHRSGVLDGIEVLDTGESETHWLARVAVWRTDMGHPFTYWGRYPRSGINKVFGLEMAIKTAESMALRRAFCVVGAPVVEEAWEHAPDVDTGEIPELPAAKVEAKKAKFLLLRALLEHGWPPGSESKNEAARLWADRVDPLSEDELEQLVAQVADYQPPER
jgi:hypothetical protein